MSRRRTFVLASVASLTALGLAFYLTEFFSPIPGLVLDLKSCLEPGGETPNGVDAASEPPQIQTKLLFVGFNNSRAGASLLADEENECKVVNGVVKDKEHLRITLKHLRGRGCIQFHSDSAITTVSGRAGCMIDGGEIPVVSAVDGVSVITYKPYGMIVEILPTVGKNGLIHLQLNGSISEPKSPAAGPGPPEIDILAEGRTSIELRDGQTCFIGMKRKCKCTTETRVPLLSDLPGVGSTFVFQHEALVDEELLIFASPALVRSR